MLHHDYVLLSFGTKRGKSTLSVAVNYVIKKRDFNGTWISRWMVLIISTAINLFLLISHENFSAFCVFQLSVLFLIPVSIYHFVFIIRPNRFFTIFCTLFYSLPFVLLFKLESFFAHSSNHQWPHKKRDTIYIGQLYLPLAPATFPWTDKQHGNRAEKGASSIQLRIGCFVRYRAPSPCLALPGRGRNRKSISNNKCAVEGYKLLCIQVTINYPPAAVGGQDFHKRE